MFSQNINIDIYDTGSGINILIEGGEKGHIGAIAIACSGEIMNSIEFSGHKEIVICERWAKEVSKVYCGPVVIEAGIHYDNITKAQIRVILEMLDKELNGLIEYIKRKEAEKYGTHFYNK